MTDRKPDGPFKVIVTPDGWQVVCELNGEREEWGHYGRDAGGNPLQRAQALAAHLNAEHAAGKDAK